MRPYKDLLFLHGHIADPRLALEMSAPQAADPDPAANCSIASPVISMRWSRRCSHSVRDATTY